MSFSYIPPGVDGSKQLSAMGDAVRDPVLPEKPLIMFAGEHTTPYHPSTMHGAFLSGIREAYRYDLYTNPKLNHHMQFESNKIYQHTFYVPRVYRKAKVSNPKRAKATPTSLKTTKKTQNATAGFASSERERRSRRRGFGGMTLRERPEPATTINTTHETASKQAIKSPKTHPKSNTTYVKLLPESHETGVRKSQRSAVSVAAELVSGDQGNSSQLEDLEKKRLDALEDRSLKRAFESYGWRNHSLICSKVVPVVGSTRKRSTNQIQSRLSHIVSTKRTPDERARVDSILEHWSSRVNGGTKSSKKSSNKSKAGEMEDVQLLAIEPNYRTKIETTEGGMSLRRTIKRPTKLQ
jgi:Flavin containing amine oxidoreductase